MGRYKKIALIIMIIIIGVSYIPIRVEANEYKNSYINFSTIDKSDGLSQSWVNYTYQDSLGYMWIGTADGLNRYDGHSFKTYRVNVSEDGHISSNYVTAIVEDDNKNLWVGTANGLNKLDRKTDKFIAYTPENSSLSHYNITEIMFDNDNNLWISTVDGVNKYDSITDSFINVLDGKDNVLSSNVYSIQIDNDELLWIGSDLGLQVYNTKTDKFESKYDKITNLLNEKFIYKLFYDTSSNSMWIGTDGDGLYKANLTTGELERIAENENISNSIRAIIKSNSGEFWFGTSEGIVRYDEVTKRIDKYKQEKFLDNTLISENVLSLTQDRSGLIWVGTVRGISKFNSSGLFKNYRYDNSSANALNDGMISGIYEDDDGYIWVNTLSKGINIINRKDETITNLEILNSALLKTELGGIDGYEDIIYIATSNGLLIIDKEENTVESLTKSDNENFPENNLRKVYVDDKGLVWIGSINGLCTLDKDRNVVDYTNLLKQNGLEEVYITSIHQDKEDSNIIWLGSAINGGLIKFNKETKEVKLFNNSNADPNKALSVNSIKSIDEDDNGNLWIATNYGLNKLNKETEEVKIFTEKDGISDNFICAAVVDEDGNVWCSTSKGISMLDVDTNNFSIFTIDDGIVCNEFNAYSYFKNKNNEIFFGGNDGLMVFNPKDIILEKYISNIVIDSFTAKGDLKVDFTEDVVLSHKNNDFEVQVFMDDYKDSANKKYYYKLEGFDREWIDNKDRNYITYTNIPAGDYQLQIVGKNSAGQITNKCDVNISVTSIPWKTPVAYWSYGIIILVVIYIWLNKVKILEQMVRQRTYELNLKLNENQMLYDKVIQHERYKNNYFVNLSHELRTPLNVIVSTEQLISKLNEGDGNIPKEKLSEYMKSVKGNSQRLLNLINNIIDTSKIESGAFQIYKESWDIVFIVEETTLSLASLAEQKNISLIVDPEIEEKIISCDKYNIERCITNLVGNALKFTKVGGQIIVKVLDFGDHIKVSVKDDGIGIDKKYHKSIFDRFGQAYKQSTEEHNGSGLGLTLTSQIIELHNGSIEVISELNEGAEFIITLPVK